MFNVGITWQAKMAAFYVYLTLLFDIVRNNHNLYVAKLNANVSYTKTQSQHRNNQLNRKINK